MGRLLLFLVATVAVAQVIPPNGPHLWKLRRYAITQATIIVKAGDTLRNATLLIEEDKIAAVGNNFPIPKGFVQIPCQRCWIYPAFIDLFSNYGVHLPKRKKKQGPVLYPVENQTLEVNEAIRAHIHPLDYWKPDTQKAKVYRSAGFALTLIQNPDGIARGWCALVQTGIDYAPRLVAYPKIAAAFSWNKGSSRQDYPTSLMGAIALLRQSLYDAQWLQQQNTPPYIAALDHLAQQTQYPWIFEVKKVHEIRAVLRLQKEFQLNILIKDAGDAYQWIHEWKKYKDNLRLIIPLNFPPPYEESLDPLESQQLTWQVLKHWQMAPANAALLYQNHIPFAITMHGSKDANTFWKHLRKAIHYGLPAEEALNALTIIPAKWLHIDHLYGTLEKGKKANFIIASDELFHNNCATVLQLWIDGKPYFQQTPAFPVKGVYRLQIDTLTLTMKVQRKEGKLQVQWQWQADSVVKVKTSYYGNRITMAWKTIQLSGFWEAGRWKGKGTWQGRTITWQATFLTDTLFCPSDTSKVPTFTASDVPRPFQAWGWYTLPQRKTYLIRNATLWTCEKEGILKGYDLLLKDGVIAAIGKSLKPPKDAVIIDAEGKHVTPGIIDEHSHIAILGGVNESGWAISSEVRIADVIRPEDINIFRQLAGGVTMAHLLHGSANPIGGQTALIKMRWGYYPDSLLYEHATPFIKFALGENVKQSNWGDRYKIRYPQTRMGVEQIIADAFTQAIAYKKRSPSRKVLRWETLKEILEGKRQITCHSYVQSEITMLIRLAQRFGIKINTFTHGLEAYKVADKLKEVGSGVSTFSDWWAYKYEVIEATPYNAALCVKVGLTTAINSDDAEMGRRLNQEAAKTVLYGGLSKEEALKTVTLYPAKLLHVDKYVGSLKVGKSADVVLWSGSPLSSTSVVEKTFVDGILYYDKSTLQQRYERFYKERLALLRAMREAILRGEKPKRLGVPEQKPTYRCHP